MSTMVKEVYSAFRSINIAEKEAAEAAEALSKEMIETDRQLTRLDAKMNVLIGLNVAIAAGLLLERVF